MSRNADNRQILRNAAASYLTLVAQVISGLVVTPLLYRSLGADVFGTFSLLLIVVSYVALLELGLGTATVRLVAERLGRQGDLEDALGSSRSLYLPIGATLGVVCIPVVAATPMLSGAGGGTPAQVRWALAALAFQQVSALLLNVYPAYVIGSGRSDLLFLTGAAASVTTSGAQVAAAVLGGGLVEVAAVTAAVGFCSSLVTMLLAKRLLGALVVRRKAASRRTRRHLLGFGVRNAGVGLVATIGSHADVLVVGSVLSARSVAAYAIAARAAGFFRTLATKASDVLVPSFADAAARQDHERQFRLFLEACLLGAAVLWPVALSVCLFAEELLALWLGSPPPTADTILGLLMASAAVQVLGHTGYVFFNGRGDLRLFLRTGACVAVLNLAVSIALTVLVGAVGPAVGTLLAALAFDLLIVPRAVTRALGRPFADLAGPLARTLAVPLVVCLVVGAFLRLATEHDPLSGTLACVTVITSFYLVLPFTMGRDRRRNYWKLVSKRVGS